MSTSAIVEFLATYTDERLAALRAHCEDGKLAWYSCCCVEGARDADHHLYGFGEFCGSENGSAHVLGDYPEVSIAFGRLGANDEERRERVLPLIIAEQRRREENLEPGHQIGCVCADCAGAELTADND